MPPRRGGRRGRGGGSQRGRNQQQRIHMSDIQENQNVFIDESQVNDPKCDATTGVQNGTESTNAEVKTEFKSDVKQENELKQQEGNDGKSENMAVDAEVKQETTSENSKKEETVSIDLPFKVKVSHLPATYAIPEFQKYLRSTFNISVPKIISPVEKNSQWLLLSFNKKEDQENCIRLLHNHIWKKKALRAIAFYGINSQKHALEDGDDPEGKKLKLDDEVLVLTLEEEILSESLPLYNVPYEEQNRLTLLDVSLLSNKLHAFMCVRNPDLAGWAEAMTEKHGAIFKIEPLKVSPLLEGYRNKCKFRIGKNTEGETTVGFCLNDNDNKILGVQPGDKLIHLPDSMKYAAKKFEDFIRASGKEPYSKKQKSGFWDHIIIRIAPEGSLMLVVVMFHNNLSDESIKEIKNQVREFFVNGDGKDCKLYSLYFQIMSEKAPILPSDKLELLHGESHFYENICGLKFYVGPFSILNVNSSSSENIYKSIAELAEPTPETTILDLCSGTGGIAFTIADKCKNVIAIESQEDHIKDALKTKEVNNIQNVEFIKGKVEDELAGVFEKLGDAPVIPIIDPPRQGLVQKAISQLRARESIKKLIYVCSNSKMGAKNFLDLCASAEKKEGTFGNPLNVVFAGLPFLPVRAIPVDVAPYTVNNTIIILFERIDPSTYPPAKNPPPVPLKKSQTRKDEKKKRRPQGRRGMRGGGAGQRTFDIRGGRKFRMQRPGMGDFNPFGGPNFRMAGHQGGGGGGGGGGFNRNRFPPPLLRPMEPALSLVAKYERRIAELEQQDRAFKAGLTMGLQALGTRGGPGGGGSGNFENFGNNFEQNSGNNNFGNFRGQFQRERSGWNRGGGRNFGNMTAGQGGGNNFGGGGGFMGGGFNNFNNTGGAGGGGSGGGGGGFGGNFGGGGTLGGGTVGGGNFNSGFGGGRGGMGGGFRNYQAKKRRR